VTDFPPHGMVEKGLGDRVGRRMSVKRSRMRGGWSRSSSGLRIALRQATLQRTKKTEGRGDGEWRNA